MDNSGSRKRPIDLADSPGDEGYADNEPSEQSKRVKDVDPIESVGLIPKESAWQFDTAELLDSPTTIPTPSDSQFNGNNFKSYDASNSLFVLCVMGEMTLQLDLLCFALPCLLETSPNLQSLILARSPSALSSVVTSAALSLPIVEAQGNPANHFLKLGLLHPLGGGQRPLDAIVVLDTASKRRLVIPFGWGAGRQVADPVTGHIVQQRFLALLEDSVKELEMEKITKKRDFYDIAKTYF